MVVGNHHHIDARELRNINGQGHNAPGSGKAHG